MPSILTGPSITVKLLGARRLIKRPQMSAAPPKEKSMMDKLSEGITSAFNTAGTEANKAKLQTEIAMKQHQIKGIKQEFGVRGQRMKSNRTSRRPGRSRRPGHGAPRSRHC